MANYVKPSHNDFSYKKSTTKTSRGISKVWSRANWDFKVFSKLEEEEKERKDETEGSRSIDWQPKEIEKISSNELAALLPSNVKISGGYFQPTPGSVVSFGHVMPDVYLFCLSEELLDNFGGSFYRITNVEKFGDILYRELLKTDKGVQKPCLTQVLYDLRKDPIATFSEAKESLDSQYTNDDSIHYSSKPTRFKKQKEWRIIFTTETECIPETQIIETLDLHQYCQF